MLQQFYEFLTSNTELNDSVRQQGREELRELVGSEIYHGPRARGAGPVCLTVSRAGGMTHGAIDIPASVRSPLIDIDIWTKDTPEGESGSRAIERVYAALEKLLPQYAGPMGDMMVQGIFQEAEPFETSVNPQDAQDNWTRRYTIPYLIGAAKKAPAGAH